MDVSIIVPTYMEEQWIEKCLKSIVNQTVPRSEYEIIVSDAHSTDNTVAIAQRYADLVLIDDRRGIAYGRNIGAKKAKSEILVFVDADTILDHNFLKHCKESFTDISVVGMTGIAYPLDGNIFQRGVYIGTYYLVRIFHMFGLSLFPGICAAYRRSSFNHIEGFREDFGVVEDLDASRRISRLGMCVVNTHAKAFVSTRRLKKNILTTVLFHISSDLRYLIMGTAPKKYPKSEEVHTWRDLWRNV